MKAFVIVVGLLVTGAICWAVWGQTVKDTADNVKDQITQEMTNVGQSMGLR